jgi:UDP-N-acetylglucosamine 2-epimerase
MYDAVLRHKARAQAVSMYPGALGMACGAYFVATLHRAENTDDPDRLRAIIEALGGLPRPVVLPVHPRTRRVLGETGLHPGANVHTINPLGYLDMLALVGGSACVLTDSGGLQKEAYYLGIPCVTLRDETEWVETVATGWNVLANASTESIVAAVERQTGPRGAHPTLYGEGDTAARIVRVLASV